MRNQALHRIEDSQDMIERVVEAAWSGIRTANLIELLVGLDGVRGPRPQKLVPSVPCLLIHVLLLGSPSQHHLGSSFFASIIDTSNVAGVIVSSRQSGNEMVILALPVPASLGTPTEPKK
jgi:hypothetical protein